MWRKIRTNMNAIIIIAAFLGVAFTGHAYFAKSADLNALASSYHFDKTTQRYNAVQERIWMLEGRCQKDGRCPAEILIEINKLKLELKALSRELAKKG